VLEWTGQQLELLPLDSVATRAEWVQVRSRSTNGTAVWELYNGGQPTGWLLDDFHRKCKALFPWALVHQDGRYIQSPYALGWKHANEARAAALRAYAGELQLVPASVNHWESKGQAFTDCGHSITDIYILQEVTT